MSDNDNKSNLPSNSVGKISNSELSTLNWDFGDEGTSKELVPADSSVTNNEISAPDAFDNSSSKAIGEVKPSVEPATIAVNSIKADYNKTQSENNTDIAKTKKVEKPVPSKKKVITRRIILGVVGALVGVLIGVGLFLMWYKHYLYSKMEILPTEVSATIVDESGNTVYIADLTEATEFEFIESETIHNFLLIGIDSRSSGRESWGNSDVNMIMSIDDSAGTIKMISIARDTYAYVPGYTNPMKINAAMAYGGPELLKATVENMLRITIDGYAFVNFYNMSGVIDAVGGVYVYASNSEVYSEHGLNWNLAEINNIQGYDPSYQAVNNSGNIWLNGRQAVAYARIRYVGNGDYERSERQVEVLRSLLSQFSALSVSGKIGAIDDVLGLIATNITEEEVTRYALNFIPSMDNLEIQYMQLPIQGCFNSGMYGSEWSIRANWNAMIPFVQEFFYGEQTQFDPVRDIPSSPDIGSCPEVGDVDMEELMR